MRWIALMIVMLAALPAVGDEGEAAADDFALYMLAKPTGITTLSLVALTVCLGLLRRVRRLKPRLMLKLHKASGACTLASGMIHGTIIMLMY